MCPCATYFLDLSGLCKIFHRLLYFILQFAVLRFFPTGKDPREYMEVSLSAWLCGDIDDEMKGQTFWPKDDRNVMKLIQMEASHDPENWNTANIQVMRFYGKSATF